MLTPAERHVRRESAAMVGPIIGATTTVQLLVIASVWGQWHLIGGLLAVHVANVGVKVATGRWAPRNWSAWYSARYVADVATVLATGVMAGWPFPVYFFLAYLGITRHDTNTRASRWRFAGALALIGPTSVLTGGTGLVTSAFVLGSIAVMLTVEKRSRYLWSVLDKVEEQNAALSRAHADLKALHQRAIEQERLSALGLLAAGVAHEVNNPMAYVSSNLQSLMAELTTAGELPEWLLEYRDDVLPATLDGIRRINTIVADLRRFARGDPEGVVPYDLNEQVRTAARIAASETKPSCEVLLDLGELPLLHGMPSQMVQVVVNLLTNAAQAQPPNTQGTITVSTRVHGDVCLLSVKDTGRGLAPEVRARVFEPFFTTKPKGTGLGLPVAHGLVTSHGGSIEVESEPGRGSTFTVRLPLAPSADPPAVKLERPVRAAETRPPQSDRRRPDAAAPRLDERGST